MKRKTSKAPSSVMAYGLGAPTVNAELVEEQLLKAHRYDNALREVSRNQRGAWQAITRELGDIDALAWEVEQLQAWIDAGRELLNAERQKERKRVENAPLSKLITTLKGFRNRRAKWLAAARRACKDDPAIAPKLAAMYVRVNDAKKALRKGSAVFWGTYQLVEESVKQGEKDAQKRGAAVQFRPWNGYSDKIGQSGRISIQIQRVGKGKDNLGMPVARLYSGLDNRAAIISGEEKARKPPRSARHAAHRARNDAKRKNVRQPMKLRMRVAGSRKNPLYAEWPLLLRGGSGKENPVIDRPIPDDAIVKRVTVHRRRVGTRFVWRLLVSYEAPSLRGPKRIDSEAAGLDVGWRRVEGGLRIAYLVDSRGEHRELVLPDAAPMRKDRKGSRAGVLARLEHADSLRAIRDQRFDELRPKLAKWLLAGERPDWLRRATRGLAQWKSTRKLVRIVYRWRDNRFAGDEAMFAEAEAWLRKERHLYQWECSERQRAVDLRKDIYRHWAKELTERYSTIVIEDFDLRDVKDKPKPEEPPDERGAREHMHVAAVGDFRVLLKNAADKRGCVVKKRPAPYTTKKCNACGGICEWDQAMELSHTCEHCGKRWDQDANAAINLLSERDSDDEGPDGARSSDGDAGSREEDEAAE